MYKHVCKYAKLRFLLSHVLHQCDTSDIDMSGSLINLTLVTRQFVCNKYDSSLIRPFYASCSCK